MENMAQNELEDCRQQIAQLTTEFGNLDERYRILIDILPQKIFVKNKELNYICCNKNYADDMGITPEEIIGKSDHDFFPPELANKYRSDDLRIMDLGIKEEIEEKYRIEDEELWVHTTKTPVWDTTGNVIGIMGIFTDVTARKRDQAELEKHRLHLEELIKERTIELEKVNARLQNELKEGMRREEIIRRQGQEILEISTPILRIWEGVVVAPLIGTLDSERTQRFMETLLEQIVETNSDVALVDITAVPMIDTQTAHHLIETISAVRLLGAQVILTGVSPSIAQTLVQLGIDLPGIITRSSLVSGLRKALDILEKTNQ